ncbi:MAG: agmatinase [candidate division WOR-3 bacterium]|nr:agmatinase [candidate division WOR-3 bacterium]
MKQRRMVFYFATKNYQPADIIIWGIPFDRTSSFIPGSRFAPSQIRIASENVESYSPYQKQDLESVKIHDAGDIIFSSSDTDSCCKKIETEMKRHLAKGKKIFAIGGEHTITIPLVHAYQELFPRLRVIQFDAHADLRDEYLGEKLCHATAMRRVAEIVGIENLFQIGIRSMTKEEARNKMNLFEIGQHLDKVKRAIGNHPTYITLDIDVLDSGVMPAVATPEPGGVSFRDLVQGLSKLAGGKIVGADLVEYNPLAAPGLAYASTAAVLVREMLLLLAKEKTKS